MQRWFWVFVLSVLMTGCEGDNVMLNGGGTSTPQVAQPPGGRPTEPEEMPFRAVPPSAPLIDPMPPQIDPAVPPVDRGLLPIEPAPPVIDPANPDVELLPMTIDSVEVLVRESFPPQISAQIKGSGGDGCGTPHQITQTRTGNVIEISIRTPHSRNAVCPAILEMFDQVIDLEGDFPAGEYILRVNGVEQTFKV